MNFKNWIYEFWPLKININFFLIKKIIGGSGFIGKLLIEKLLRSCPEINSIFILLREKRGQKITERLQKICNLSLFDLLRIKNPNFADKLIPIAGDVSEIGLGLSCDDKKLMENVSIIFHSAASIRFDDPLKDAVLLNTRGTLEIYKFAESLKNVMAVMHVSTAYSNVHLSEIKEKVHPAITDWRKTIKICEKAEKSELDVMTKHFINFMPNTYVFSKHLAEQISLEYSKKLPVMIFRPSIVLPAYDEPFGGFVSNFLMLKMVLMP